MQGQEVSAKAIEEDIDDQYRLLRRDVQHGRAELVRLLAPLPKHAFQSCMDVATDGDGACR